MKDIKYKDNRKKHKLDNGGWIKIDIETEVRCAEPALNEKNVTRIETWDNRIYFLKGKYY